MNDVNFEKAYRAGSYDKLLGNAAFEERKIYTFAVEKGQTHFYSLQKNCIKVECLSCKFSFTYLDLIYLVCKITSKKTKLKPCGNSDQYLIRSLLSSNIKIPICVSKRVVRACSNCSNLEENF